MSRAKKVFWQVSSTVTPETITTVTKGCGGNCMISARTMETTLMSVSAHYDKHGRLHIKDPNRKETNLYCSTCDKAWVVDQDYNIKDTAQ